MQIKMKSSATVLAASILAMLIVNNTAVCQPVTGLAGNEFVLPGKTCVIPFVWQGDTMHSKWEAHTAMLILVKIKHCPGEFYLQFDLGAPYSLLYKNKLEAIQKKYPQTFSTNNPDSMLKNFYFSAGNKQFQVKNIIIKQFDTSGIDWSNKNNIEIIGTIGADLIDHKVLAINYPKRRLIVSETVPDKWVRGVSLTDFIYTGRRIILPAKILDKETKLYFDTGSSMFSLLADKTTCLQLAAPGAVSLQSEVKSWGSSLTAHSIPTDESIELAGRKIPLHYATYIEGVSSSQVEYMAKLGIGGMTGNKLFINTILLIDTGNKKFGLITD